MGGDGDLGLLSTKKRSLTAVFNHLTGGPAGLWGQWGAAGTSCSSGHGKFVTGPCKPRREAWTQRIVKVTKSNSFTVQDKQLVTLITRVILLLMCSTCLIQIRALQMWFYTQF